MSTQGLSGGAFDFDTQAGIAQLLASVRAADISAEERNDLRDTIFLYTNGGRDQTVRISLEQKLESLGISPVATAATANKDRSPMSFSRSAPGNFSVSKSFKTPPSSPQSATSAQPDPVATAKEPPAPQPVSPAVQSPTPSQPAPQAAAQPIPAAASPAPAQQPVPTTPAQTIAPPVTPQSPAPQPPSPTTQPATPAQPPAPATTGTVPAVNPSLTKPQTPPPQPNPVSAKPVAPQAPPATVKPPAAPTAPAQAAPSITSQTPLPTSNPAPVTPPAEPVTAPADENNSVATNQPPQSSPAAVPDAVVPGESPEVYLNRIKAIKSIVNQKVGNPVNLVDIDNEVGREYMGALLDAMKKINSGASAVSAMKRLEESLKSVEKAIADHNAKGPEETKPPQPNQNPAPAPSAPSVPVKPPQPTAPVAPPKQPAQNPTPEPIAKQSEPSVTPEPPVAPKPLPVRPLQPEPMAKPVDTPAPVPPVSVKTDPAPTPQKPPLPVNKPVEQAAQGDNNLNEPNAEAEQKPMESRVPIQAIPAVGVTPKPEEEAGQSKVESFGSRSEVPAPAPPKPQESPDLSDKAAPTAENQSEADKAQNDDPLYLPEIDDGLNQLLAEWSLFKKSGLFGSGPKGREHPLFKKIANLQIPLLLAGRFEGATQEIKQSITDYMNGWRYEQGIIYNQGETFERYLRRVIKHILDLQKKKTPA